MLRSAVLTLAFLLLAAAPAGAAPGILGAGTDPGVAVDSAGTAHVGWLGGNTLEYCQVPRGTRKCSVRQTFPLSAPGIADVQVLAPRPGAVFLVASVLSDPAVLLSSADGGATFASRPIGSLGLISQAVFGPGETVALLSDGASFARYGTDGAGPPDWAVSFADATEALSTSLASFGGGYAAFFGGASQSRSALWNGLGDPNLPQSWVEGPRLGSERLAPSAMGGPRGTYVAYTDRRRGSAMRVRRLRSTGRLGPARRVSGDDPTAIHAAQGPRGDMIVLWRKFPDEVRFVRSRKGSRWTRPRRLFRGHEPQALRPALGARGGWMVWAGGGSDSVVRIAALPRAPRR